MADATASTADAGSKRPEKPDEAAYKAALAEAEKKHKLASDKAVSFRTCRDAGAYR
jgi:hypothetical protein